MSDVTLEVAGMRAEAERLLSSDADVPTYDGLHELTLRLRGHLMLLIPAVTDQIAVWPRNDDALAGALGSVGRAHRRLDEQLSAATLSRGRGLRPAPRPCGARTHRPPRRSQAVRTQGEARPTGGGPRLCRAGQPIGVRAPPW
ncbi:DUF6415 family natural product biosynthesis protein [Streptomyces sp. MUM 178J]|uniref:DUF6415 family natural product biosynthesis protein n=1 Tax=Streptomyces sp. MUM 178J TaxID=2791991 RepID=UPI003FA6D9C2